MEARVCFPALIVQEQAGRNGDMLKLPLFAVKKHWETVSIVVFQYQGGKWAKESKSVLAPE